MELGEASTDLDIPNVIYLSVFDVTEQDAVNKAIGLIRKSYASEVLEQDKTSIRLNLQDGLCVIEPSQAKNCFVFSLSLYSPYRDDVSNRWQDELQHYRIQVNTITDILPKNPILALFIFVNPVHSQDEIAKLVQQYGQHIASHKVAAGIVNGHLIAIFRITDDAKKTSTLRREIVISSINQSFLEGKNASLQLVEDLKDLHINLARLRNIYQSCQPYFPQLDPAETEVQEKTETILNRIRQTEPVDPETLKSWLADVMDRSSALSIMSSLIVRDQITARTCVDENESMLNRWSERNLEGYSTNTTMEAIEYNSMMRPFNGFIDRTQALRTRLETVSDTIRTYLGIQQQEQNAEILKQQVKMLHSIERHENFLKGLTWAVVLLTITLVIVEIARALRFLP